MVRPKGKQGFPGVVLLKKNNIKKVKWMSVFSMGGCQRTGVLLEQWKTGWVSCDFRLCHKSVIEFILNVLAL